MAKKYAVRPDLAEFVDRLVASGRYERAEDAIADGLELLKDQEFAREARRAELFAKIDQGMEDVRAGRTVPAEQVFAELHRMIDESEAKRDAAE
jgi:antitoxin ParD1/3/4